MVCDPRLAAHLAHFGVDAAAPLKPAAPSVVGLGLEARAHFNGVLARWIGAREENVGALFANFHPLAQDLLIQEYRRQMRVRRLCPARPAQSCTPGARSQSRAAGRPGPCCCTFPPALSAPAPPAFPPQAYHALQRRRAGEGSKDQKSVV